MRVIAGTARRLLLKTIEGRDTRPTTDRIKETLFNILQSEIYGCRFLDLFGGSGAIGIEALSRGAAAAVFVEQRKDAASCIRENLRFTRLEDRAEVLVCDVLDGGYSVWRGVNPFILSLWIHPTDRERNAGCWSIFPPEDFFGGSKYADSRGGCQENGFFLCAFPGDGSLQNERI